MPNFAEFYSEEGVNNQGIECLRFLNEIISDYDQLLDDARFQGSITKIKTIGATYMVQMAAERVEGGGRESFDWESYSAGQISPPYQESRVETGNWKRARTDSQSINQL